ncbi:NF-kappa-B inhibitor delta [Sesbania bispinosa]|nr:NF-kappa-B inhibitor delta [Sesbania bispinosa]
MHGGSQLADRGDVVCCWDDGGGGWRCTEAQLLGQRHGSGGVMNNARVDFLYFPYFVCYISVILIRFYYPLRYPLISHYDFQIYAYGEG